MKLTILAIDHHRNGIGGAPFHSVIFADSYHRGRFFHATVFDAEGAVAVHDIALLAEKNVAFCENSWRGDMYEHQLRTAIEAHERRADEARAAQMAG